MKKIAILQSNYVPWLGYFQLIDSVDEFILYDDVQFTRRDWRNRNRIKTPQGVQWLSIPVGKSIHRRIRDVEVCAPWRENHWETLERNYRQALSFNETAEWLQPLYLESQITNLSDINKSLIEAICDKLGIKTRITSSSDYELIGDRNERLVNLCLQTTATHYVSGPAAKAYLDSQKFSENSISVDWFDYSEQNPYPQLWGGFVEGLSVLDGLFNIGSKLMRVFPRSQE